MSELTKKIEQFRRDYSSFVLSEENLPANPLVLFDSWISDAMDSAILDPNAMVLSTVSAEGKPSSRIVLLRDFDEHGFVFYTNYNSQKATDTKANNYATINFYWDENDRQVRISGILQKTTEAVSDAYFAKRPRETQLGAWASAQSSTLANREQLEAEVEKMRKKFEGAEIPRPPHWGGYVLKHDKIEFWQGRPARLHDRFLYTRKDDGSWGFVRLAP